MKKAIIKLCWFIIRKVDGEEFVTTRIVTNSVNFSIEKRLPIDDKWHSCEVNIVFHCKAGRDTHEQVKYVIDGISKGSND